MIDPVLRAELLKQTEHKPEFKITNIEQATWAFRKLAAMDQADEEINRAADYDIKQTESWRQSELDKNQGSREYFRKLLFDYYRENAQQNKKYEVKTPYGHIKTYKGRKTWKYNDEELIKSLKANDAEEFIKTHETVNKAELKKSTQVVNGKVATADGTILDGVFVEQQPDYVEVKLTKHKEK